MKRYFVIETPEQLKSAGDPLRIRLVTRLVASEATGKQLADELQMSASRVHYHLHELEDNGLVEVVRTEEKNGIVQKFYRAVAIDYVVSEQLLPSGHWDASTIQEVMANQLRVALSRVYETDEECFQVDHEGTQSSRWPFIHGIWEIRAQHEALLEWGEKFRALMAELGELERSWQNEQGGESAEFGRAGEEEIFFMTAVGFPTNIETLRVDQPGLPEGYHLRVDPQTGEVTAHKEGESQ